MSVESQNTPLELEEYLHTHIPISAAMGVRVLSTDPAALRLRAPLAENINHRSTVFGGSASAVAILAGWSLLHVMLGHGGRRSRIVIQRSSIEYRHPIDGDFEAVSLPPAAEDWARFEKMLKRKGRSRIDLTMELRSHGEVAGTCTGSYVVLPPDPSEIPGGSATQER